MIYLVLTVFLVVSEPDLLPLDETVTLDPDIILCDEAAEWFEMFDIVFTVKSVTRRVSMLGWISERYDIEIGHELKGDLPENTVFMYTFPCGMYSNQLSSLTEGEGLVVYASILSSPGSMEGLRSSLGTLSVCLYSPILK
jgi:hypothetical protein